MKNKYGNHLLEVKLEVKYHIEFICHTFRIGGLENEIFCFLLSVAVGAEVTPTNTIRTTQRESLTESHRQRRQVTNLNSGIE